MSPAVTSVGGTSSHAGAANRLSRSDSRSLAGMAGVVIGLHLIGWVTLVAVVAPARYTVGNQIFGIGLGLTAYALGMRHAFDADHIAAIDNTTRTLMGRGQKPLSVGFWFSLGHSSIVFALCLLLSAGIRTLAGQIENEHSMLQQLTGIVGTAISGTFLLAIALANFVILMGVVRVFRRMRAGSYDEAALEEQLNKRGFVNRILGGVTKAVSKPCHMYLVGLLFGLGFDTATEVSLLVLAGGAAAFSLPWYAILTLPILFAAGMSLLDTIDGAFMNFTYGWALSKPVRKVYYNMTVTGLSVMVALVIGSVELVSIMADKLDITSGPIRVVADIDLNKLGYAIVVLFMLTWLAAIAGWRVFRVEDRWSAAPNGRVACADEAA
jgi:high-affinity nickel-transport protein